MVAIGNYQQADIDCHETCNLVVKPPTIGLVLSLAFTFGWPIEQLDVKNAFLHGILSEEVYIHKPHRFVHPHLSHHVCKLKKAIYGLEQAPSAWFHTFNSFLLSYGFTCSPCETSMFVYHHSSTSLIFLSMSMISYLLVVPLPSRIILLLFSLISLLWVIFIIFWVFRW